MSCLDELLLEWEDRRARGEQVDVATLCPDTELRPELAERIRLLEAFDALAACVANPPAAPPLPERIGKYQVTRKLGAGGMGVVYEATDPVLERTVAIKVLKTDSPLAPTGRAVEQFMREVRILGRFARKSIVVAYEAGESDGLPYLVMDYLPNGSLASHQKRLTEAGPAAVAALMEQVARAVQDAHSIGVLHRDLKPSNVLLDEKGVPFIADFGLAAVLATAPALPTVPAGSHGSADVITRRGAGTPPYMAPEQFDPSFGPVGTPTDVWALGVMLFELLTGRRPFSGQTRDELQEQVCKAPLPPLPVGRRWRRVIERCLAKDPACRFRTAGELANALKTTVTPRRWPAFTLATSLALGIGYPFVPVAERPAPKWPDVPAVREAQDRLARTGTIELIGPNRPPAAFDFVTGPGSGRIISRAGEPFRVVSASPVGCLVELLPALPPGRYKVEAELEHETGNGMSWVGLYAGASHCEIPRGRQHFLLLARYADRGWAAEERPENNTVTSNRRTHLVAQYLGDTDNDVLAAFEKQAPAPGGRLVAAPPVGRRRISLTLDATGAAAVQQHPAPTIPGRPARGDEPVGTLPLIEINRSHFYSINKYIDLHGSDLTVNLHGGTGVYVSNGSLIVHSFRVTLLHPAG